MHAARSLWSAEFNFLVAACGHQEEEPLADVSLRQLDWDRIRILASKHGVLAYLNSYIRRYCIRDCPPDVASSIHQQVTLQSRRSLFLTSELLRVVGCLENAGIQYLTLKGPSLSQLIHGNVAHRSYSDIDILFSKEQFGNAREVLLSLGYTALDNLTLDQQFFRAQNVGEIHFTSGHGGIIDLHTNLNSGAYPIRTPWKDLWDRRMAVEISSFRVATLGPQDLALYLAVHGAKHRWSRLIWLLDFAQFTNEVCLDLTKMRAYVAAEQVKVCELAFHLSSNVFPLFTRSVSENERPDIRQERLIDQCIRRLEPGEMHANWYTDFSFLLRARRRPFDAFRFFLSQLTLPHLHDWNSVTLPRSLWFLYAFLRPLRLIAKYIRRA